MRRENGRLTLVLALACRLAPVRVPSSGNTALETDTLAGKWHPSSKASGIGCSPRLPSTTRSIWLLPRRSTRRVACFRFCCVVDIVVSVCVSFPLNLILNPAWNLPHFRRPC